VSFRPEQIEEESCAEDGGDEDACEDVVGRGADVVVVVDVDFGVEVGDEALGVDVVCGKGSLISMFSWVRARTKLTI
jgi:hypothetical protein